MWLFAIPWAVACQAPLGMGTRQGRILEWVAMHSSWGSSQPRDWTQVSCIAGEFFTTWTTRKAPKNTGAGSLSLLQENFLIQELNQGLLHCRQILYHLSYQGSPMFCELFSEDKKGSTGQAGWIFQRETWTFLLVRILGDQGADWRSKWDCLCSQAGKAVCSLRLTKAQSRRGPGTLLTVGL